MAPWLIGLDEQQLAVATSRSHRLRVLAGAGTGKTTALTARLANDLLDLRIPPEQLLLLTFTRRAARGMLNRTEALIARSNNGVRTRMPVGGTFHSVANLALRSGEQNFSVIDRADCTDLMGIVRSDVFANTKPNKRFPRNESLVAIYSRAINAQCSISDAVATEAPWATEHVEQVITLCQEYVRRKQQGRLLDFDDLLLYWLEALLLDGGRPDRQYSHVLVDEYQDVNALQVQIVRALAGEGTRVTAVGDDAQSIYSFRGSNPDFILDFDNDFPGCNTLHLTNNYRSTPEVLAVANALAQDAPRGFSNQLVSVNDAPAHTPELVVAHDDDDQCIAVCEDVLRQYEDGVALRDQAVLVRAAVHSAALELELTARGIPFVKYGGLKYLESAHVKDCLAAFRLIENPRDEMAWFRLLQMLNGVGKSTVNKIVTVVREHITSDAGTVNDAGPEIIAALPPKARVEATVLLSALQPATTSTKESQARDVVAALTPLIDRKYDNAESRLNDLSVLVHAAGSARSLSEVAAEYTLEEPAKTSDLAGQPVIDDDYLVVSTIHSAKGLEWDSVHILNVTDGAIPLDMSVETAGGREEERRLLYVALTRAKTSLQIHAPVRFHVDRIAATDRHVWAQPSRFLSPRVLATLRTTHRDTEVRLPVEEAPPPDLTAAVSNRLNGLWR